SVMHLLDACRQRPLVTALVEDETAVDDPLLAADRGQDLLGAGHLGNQLRVDEAGGLDPAQPRRCQPVAELSPGLRLEDCRLVLKAVAGTDVANLDLHTTPCLCRRSSSASSSPSSPR